MEVITYWTLAKVWGIMSLDRSTNIGFELEKFRFRKEIGRNWFYSTVVDESNGLIILVPNQWKA